MFKKLALKNQYTDCLYCNYVGCDFARQKYGEKFGHWIWTFDKLVASPVKSALNLKRQFKRIKRRLTALDYSKIDDIEVDGIDHRDHPDYVDAFISSATYKGREMTDKELDRLNEDSDFVYQCVIDRIY